MSDARFEDADERPLRLLARDSDDLRVISALVQDAVLTGADLGYQRRTRRFSLLINRFRWEIQSGEPAADRPADRPAERVRSLLVFNDVLRVRQQGLEARDPDTVLSLLAIDFTPAEAQASDDDATGTDPAATSGRVTLVFAGDGVVALDIDCIEVHLSDVTRPYNAPSRLVPEHPLGPQTD